jgi:hypothetical protein
VLFITDALAGSIEAHQCSPATAATRLSQKNTKKSDTKIRRKTHFFLFPDPHWQGRGWRSKPLPASPCSDSAPYLLLLPLHARALVSAVYCPTDPEPIAFLIGPVLAVGWPPGRGFIR